MMQASCPQIARRKRRQFHFLPFCLSPANSSLRRTSSHGPAIALSAKWVEAARGRSGSRPATRSPFCEAGRMGKTRFDHQCRKPYLLLCPAKGSESDQYWTFISSPPVIQTRWLKAIGDVPRQTRWCPNAKFLVDQHCSRALRRGSPGAGLPVWKIK